MKKRIISCIILFLLTSIIIYVIKISNDDDTEYSNLMWMSATGYGATYYFVLNSDRILEASVGTRSENSELQYVDFMEQVNQKESIRLKNKDFQKILKLADKVVNSEKKKIIVSVSDGYEIDLYYEGNIYKANYPEKFRSLYNLWGEIKQLSPIEIR